MKLTNLQIEQYFNLYSKEFQEFKSYIPAKISFYITKNINALSAAAETVQTAKLSIAQHYGTPNEEQTGYTISPENMPAASKEIEDLYSIEQEIEIKTFSIDSLDGVDFTPAQMNAIIFMIEE